MCVSEKKKNSLLPTFDSTCLVIIILIKSYNSLNNLKLKLDGDSFRQNFCPKWFETIFSDPLRT